MEEKHIHSLMTAGEATGAVAEDVQECLQMLKTSRLFL